MMKTWSYEEITNVAEDMIVKSMKDAEDKEKACEKDGARRHREWAFGIYRLWVGLTYGILCDDEKYQADDRRLHNLVMKQHSK